MAARELVRLAQDLEWLGCELEYFGNRHAQEGFPEGGPAWNAFLDKRRGVLRTAEKIEGELKGAVRFNPARLIGVDFPLEATLESIAQLLAAVDEIKRDTVYAVHDLPARTRQFTYMVQGYLESMGER